VVHIENLMEPKKIKNGLRTDFIGREIHHFTKLSSTNNLAKELAMKGVKEGTIIIAETQSRGRGRVGRRWVSPKGGIWFSTILRPQVSPKDALKLTFMTAVAVAKTVRKTFNLNAEIKWPNDVLINGRKVCGILTEMSTRGNIVDFVVIGVGINANVDVDALPEYLKGSVTSLEKEMKGEVERESFLRALLEELEHYYKMFERKGFDIILEEWKSLSSLLGAYVEILSFDEKIEGLAIDVDQNGALIIKLKDGPIRKVMSGDVTVRKR